MFAVFLQIVGEIDPFEVLAGYGQVAEVEVFVRDDSFWSIGFCDF